MLVSRVAPEVALDGNTQPTKKMHDEKRWRRYFNMHTLTGAELAKLIDLKLLSGMRAGYCARHRNDGAY
jgi:hypothetical protein